MTANRVILDFETFSRADLTEVGAWRYSEDVTTGIHCMAYKAKLDPWHNLFFDYDTGKEPRLWLPGNAMPPWVADRIWEQGILLEAHNAFFEASLWTNVLHKRLGWPQPPPEAWTCTASRAAMCALPRALGAVGEALGLPVVKSEEGHKVMMSLAKPRIRKPVTQEEYPGEYPAVTRARKGYQLWLKEAQESVHPGEYEVDPDGSVAKWYTAESDPSRFATLYSYVCTDVLAEEALSEAIPELSPLDRQAWLLDQKINRRGVFIDLPSVARAVKVIEEYESQLNKEVEEKTKGFLANTNQRQKLLQWVQSQGVPLENIQAETIDTLLASGKVLPEDVRRVLEIRRSLGRTSTKKLYAMLSRTSPDGRARDNLMFRGASTGRPTGRGLQILNLAKPTIAGFDQDEFFRLLQHADWAILKQRYGDPIESVSCGIRGFICAPEGYDILAADYAAIEARVVAWLSGQDDLVEMFRQGEDVYKEMAAAIYSKSKEEILPEERQLGKQVILGCFGGDTPVLTHTGWKRITDVSKEDLLWDGVEWVSHQGVKYQGEKEVIDLLGIHVTPDHQILVGETWLAAGTVAQSEKTLYQALVTASDTSPYEVIPINRGEIVELPPYPVFIQNTQAFLDILSKETPGKKKIKTYDILLAGPRSRFTILTSQGAIIAHNCGYGMSATKFQITCAGYGIEISLEFAEKVVRLYRNKYSKIRQYWRDTEDAAIEAVITKRPVVSGYVVWEVVGNFLTCKLPSGRLLRYYSPTLVDNVTPWGEVRRQLSFMGVNSVTKQWWRETTHGAKIVENLCQAIAWDLMEHGALSAEAKGYMVTNVVYDELVAEAPEGFGSVEEFCASICDLPDWGKSIPVVAEGWRGKRYTK